MYEKGLGVDNDDREALKWYRKAAEKNHAQAQYHLGNMYENGRGVAEDLNEAKSWYRKAANQKHEKAAVALTRLATESSQAKGGGAKSMPAASTGSKGGKNDRAEFMKQYHKAEGLVENARDTEELKEIERQLALGGDEGAAKKKLERLLKRLQSKR